jgi:hypothetical protein
MQDVHNARLCRRGEAGYCAQLMWAELDLGLSPVQPNNGGPGPAQKKKIFTLFCLNISLYFMS